MRLSSSSCVHTRQHLIHRSGHACTYAEVLTPEEADKEIPPRLRVKGSRHAASTVSAVNYAQPGPFCIGGQIEPIKEHHKGVPSAARTAFKRILFWVRDRRVDRRERERRGEVRHFGPVGFKRSHAHVIPCRPVSSIMNKILKLYECFSHLFKF